MNDAFKIYVDQLRDGHEEIIHEMFEPDFIDINEKDLKFKKPVQVEGKAYMADDSLVLNFDITTEASLLCTVCNTVVPAEIKIHNFYHAVPLDEIKGGIYYMQDILRETILLETPNFQECNGGNCPEREKLSKYLKTPKSENDTGADSSDEEGYRPFSNLKLE